MSTKPDYGNYVPVLLDPVAEAKAVEEPLCKNKTENSTNEDNLRIVAPMTMREGLRLHVDCGGTTYVVTIPQGGVEDGETFVASGRRKAPITGGWRDGLFECFQPIEGNFMAAAFCVRGLAFACLMEPLKMDCFFRRNSPIPHGVVYGFMCVLLLVLTFLYINQQMAAQTVQTNTHHSSMHYSSTYHSSYNSGGSTTVISQPSEPIVPPIFTGMLGWYMISLFIAVRFFTRMKYKIPGNLCIDCLSVYFCGCCSALQIFRHMKASGDEPAQTRLTYNTKAELVGDEECVLEAKASVIDEETVASEEDEI